MAEAVGFEPTCPCGQLHFECSSLQPLRYASMHKYSLFRTNHMISSAAPSTSRTTLRVCISICFFFAQISVKKFLERKAGENTEKYSIYDFENPYKWGISGGRNDQAAVKFRVLHLRPLGQLSVFQFVATCPIAHRNVYYTKHFYTCQ